MTIQERALILADAFGLVPDKIERPSSAQLRDEAGTLKKIKSFSKTYTKALLHSTSVLLLGPFTDRGRREIENVSVLAASEKASREHPKIPAPEPVIPQIPAYALMNLPYRVVVQKAEAIHGNVSLLELLIICKLVRAINPAVSFEIGTFDGRTTLNIAANSEDTAKVFTLDLPQAEMTAARLHLEESDRRHIEKDESGSLFSANPLQAKISQLFGDSATFDFSKYYTQVDFIFIDGSHSYEYVLSDSRNAIDMLSSHGVILWHDYGAEWWPGVTQALNELYRSDARFKTMRYIEGTNLVVLWRDPMRKSR